MGAHVARRATAGTQMGETSNVGASVDAEGLVDLFLTVDGQLIQRAGTAGDQAVVDQTQVVNEVTLALLFAFGGALTGLSAAPTTVVITDFIIQKKGVQVCRKSIPGSADGADHHVEVASSFTRQAGAFARGQSHLLGLAVGVGDQGASSGLHDGNSTCGGTGGNAQSGIGLAETVQAAVLQHGSVAGEQCVGDVTQNDLAITQASSHLAVGVHTTVGGGQAGVLAADAGDGVRHDA